MNNVLDRPGSVIGDPTLYVIAPVFNPVRYHSRYRLYQEFKVAKKSWTNRSPEYRAEISRKVWKTRRERAAI